VAGVLVPTSVIDVLDYYAPFFELTAVGFEPILEVI
jgi:hypothetical protein